MRMEGDGREGQPAEGVDTLTDMVALLDDGEEGSADALDESEEGEEVPDESEGEEVDQEDGEEDAQEESTVVLKHDGKEVTLKQSEVVELAQKGFDYTQKTMQVAEERKAAEEEREHAAQYRQQYEQTLTQSVGQLQALERVLKSSIGSPPPVELAQQDVALYIAQKEQYEARKGQLAEATEAIARMQDEQARSRQAWIADKALATEKSLKGTLPGWTDTTLNDLIAYAGKLGLGERQFDSAMVEPGFWEMAHKAKAYDELLAKKAQMKPVAQLTKVAPPQARNQPPQLARRQEAVKRYGANPSLKTLADLL